MVMNGEKDKQKSADQAALVLGIGANLVQARTASLNGQ